MSRPGREAGGKPSESVGALRGALTPWLTSRVLTPVSPPHPLTSPPVAAAKESKSFQAYNAAGRKIKAVQQAREMADELAQVARMQQEQASADTAATSKRERDLVELRSFLKEVRRGWGRGGRTGGELYRWERLRRRRTLTLHPPTLPHHTSLPPP